jgi:glyceraldehyde 3-phosphate dehydrogenase
MTDAPRIAINGLGRIGRAFLRAILARESSVDVVAVHDLTPASTLAYLLQYDSVHGRLGVPIEVAGDELRVGERRIRVLRSNHPANLPWSSLGVDVVAECSGQYTTRERAAGHLLAGAKRVIISTPTDSAEVTICVGVNEATLDPAAHRIISNASCTTNCVAPMFAILDEAFGVEGGWVDTVHAFTNDQQLLDLPHHDLRRSRAAGQNIVPTGTGADRALALVLPQLKDRVHSVAVRVPVPDGSLSNVVAMLRGHVTAERVREAFIGAVRSKRWSGIVGVTDVPMVSSDILGDPRSCVISLQDIESHGNAVRLFGWYDNEWGYANRLLDLVEMVCARSNVRPPADDLGTQLPALIGSAAAVGK